MKKGIIFILCILLLTSCADTYDGPTQEKLVLTEYQTCHYSPFWEGEVMLETRTTYVYDIYGNRVQEMDYRDGELSTVTKLRYDDRGNLIEEITWDHSGWIPHINRRRKQTFDEQNRLLSLSYYDMWGRKTSESTYTHDDEARTQTWSNGEGDTQITWYDENGSEVRQVLGIYETVYEYDDRGNRIGWQSFENGEPSDSYKARYDDQDRQIWGGRYDKDGNLESETTYVYNDEEHTLSYDKGDGGRRIECYTPDGRPSYIEDYDRDGNLSMVQIYTYRDIQVPKKEEAP